MKKFLSLLAFSLVLVSGQSFAYDNGPFTHQEASMGSPADVPYRLYRLVRYSANSKDAVGLSAGDVVIWDLISDDGVSVNTTSASGVTTSTDSVAGVVVGSNTAAFSTSIPTGDSASTSASADVGRRNWGYIQTYGLCTNVNLDLTNGTYTAGDGIRASSRPRYACSAEGSGGVDSPNFGFSYDTASAAGKDNEAFIRC